MNRLYGLIVAIALGCLFSGRAPAEGRGDSFDWVWQTVHDKFYDAKFNGVDWNAMKTKYRDRAIRAATREQHAAIINEMLAELRTSHTVFYTPDTPQYFQLLGLFLPQNDWLRKAAARTLTNGKALYSGIGIFTETVNGQHFVRGVHEGLPAHKAGIRVGDRLVSVDGARFHAIRSFEGKAGKPIAIVVEETPGAAKTLTVTPAMLDGSTMFADAMRSSVQIVERDALKIGYIHAWSYAGPRYQEILESEVLYSRLENADALVLDIRDGYGGASPSNLNLFTQRCLSWTAQTRSGPPQTIPSCWAKPVVLLTDNRSSSGKELLAYAFKRGRVGSIVGARTAGAVLGGTIFANEADASLLYLATTDVRMDDGTRLEGKGVEPDIEVPFHLPFAQGRDLRKARAIDEAARLVNAATAADPVQSLREIDRDIWKPFVQGVSTFDHDLYLRVRAKDSIFVDGKRLFGYDAYVEDAIRVMTPLEKAGTRLNMQVRFEERITDGAHASERGVLRTTLTDNKGVERTSHARFHVISRKQADGWRIVTDYRWRTDVQSDAQAFAAARAPEDFER